MTTAPADPRLAAAQAYVRLLHTVRAVLSDESQAPMAVPVLSAPLAEADAALQQAGFAGNERELLALVYELPHLSAAP